MTQPAFTDEEKQLMNLGRFRDSIYKSNEYYKIRDFRLFRNSYLVFKANYNELNKKLCKHEKDDVFELRQNQIGKNKINRFQLEITRCLHNFLASAYTLVDNSRKQNKSLDNNSFLTEYNLKVDETFKNNINAVFIHDLRRFTQHFKLPQVATTTTYSRSDHEGINKDTKIFITTTHLKNFEWSSKSKRFIEDQPKGIDLRFIIKEYYDLVTRFQKWYENELKAIIKPELCLISEQEKELNKRQLLFSLNRFFSGYSLSKKEFETILFRHISNYYICKIVKSNKTNRLELILRSLKNININPDEYKEQIEKLTKYWP